MQTSRVPIGGIGIDPLTEAQVLRLVQDGWRHGYGGLIVTPNVDIWRRARREPTTRNLIDSATVVTADGMPLVWASHLRRTPLPERVCGSGLVESLCAACADSARSVFVLGGGIGDTAERAAAALADRYAGLGIAGAIAPPFGFDQDVKQVDAVVERVVASRADLVLVGLGFPRQERLAVKIREQLSSAWLIGCGAGVAMAAGDTKRPPEWVQRMGGEWLFRLAQEPRRLAHRYLVDDLPAAAQLLAMSYFGSVWQGSLARRVRAHRRPHSLVGPPR